MYPATTRRYQSTLLALFIFLQIFLTRHMISSSTTASVSKPVIRRASTVTRQVTISYLQSTTAAQPTESGSYNITLGYIGSTNAAFSWVRPVVGSIDDYFVVQWKQVNSNSSYEANAGRSTHYEVQHLQPDTNYTVTVYLHRNGTRKVYGINHHFRTEKAEKPSIILVDVSNSSITVNFSGTAENVNINCSPQCGIANYTNKNNATGYVFHNLLAGENYTIELQMPHDRSFTTAKRTIYTRANIPDFPLVTISSNNIHLKWSVQNNNDQLFIVQYHLHDSQWYSELRLHQRYVSVGGNSMLPGHTYSISLFALVDGLESDHAHLLVTTRPSAPDWKKSEIYDYDGKINLTWTVNETSYQDSFNISFNEYHDNSVRTVVAEDGLWTEIEDLVPGAKYEFSICACSRNICSDYTRLSHVMKPRRPSVYVESVDERSAMLVFLSQSQPQRFIHYSVSVHSTSSVKQSRQLRINTTPTNQSEGFYYNLTDLFPGESYTMNISSVTVDGVTSENYEDMFTTIPVIDIKVTQLPSASTSDSVTVKYTIGRKSACDKYIFKLNTDLMSTVNCTPDTGTVAFDGLNNGSEYTLYYEAWSDEQRSRDRPQLKVYTAPAQPTGLICDSSNKTLTVCIPRQSANVDYTITLYNLNSSDADPINTSCNTVLHNDTDRQCVQVESHHAAVSSYTDARPTDDNRCFLCNTTTHLDSSECSGENVLVVNEKCNKQTGTGRVGIKACNSSGDACLTMSKCDHNGVDGCYSVLMCKFVEGSTVNDNCTNVHVYNKVDTRSVRTTETTTTTTTTTMPLEEQCKHSTRLVFDNLDAISEYRFDVTAVWRGLHSTAGTLSCVTRETLPGPVVNLRVTTLEPNSMTLSWKEPRSKSGRFLRYDVALLLMQDERRWMKESHTTDATFDKLVADKMYVVEVAAVTSIGIGPITSLNVTLPIRAPFVTKWDNFTTERHVDHDHFIVQLVNPFSDEYGQVVSYSVLIAQKSNNRRSQNDEVDDCRSGYYCRIIVDRCPTLFNAENVDANHCLKSGSPESFTGSTKLLTVGTDENCVEQTYCNYKLEPSTEYFVFIRGYNRLNKFSDSPLSKPIKTSPIPPPSDFTSVALITVVILLVIIAAAIIIFLYFRWRSPPLKALNRYARQNTIRMAALPSLSSKPIGAYDFVEHVASLEKDSGLLFSDEFEELKFVGRDQACEQAELQCNRAKNRFTNILPYDSTRVKLLPVEDVEGSDYINANWIPGFISKREFIATQGPLPSTKDDFWRLIWEYNCRAVVMLTLCMENGRIKCDQYWPMDAEPVFYGDLEIKIMNETITSSWHIRELQISLGEQSRRIKHFHYLEWPDMKVPDQLSMLAFVRQVRCYVNSKVGGPIVVHCSAGVGRSGTFIALDVLLQQLEHDDVIDVYGVVCRMRLGRVLMVQTEQQYIFVYECMKHVLLEQLVKPTILHNTGDSSPVYKNSRVSNEANNDSDSEASEANEASEASETSTNEKNSESENAEDEGIADNNTVNC